MDNLEEVSAKTQLLQREISFLERSRSLCIKYSIDYYRDGNQTMNDVMKLRLEKIRNRLSTLRSDFIKAEEQRKMFLSAVPGKTIRTVHCLNIQNYESWMQ